MKNEVVQSTIFITKRKMFLNLFDDDYDIWKTFSFKNFWKNEILKIQIYPMLKKTGTTIVGLTFLDGVILAADTRATNGDIVCDSDCDKIHFISKNISCCGAGTSADTENITKMISEQIELKRLFSERESTVQSAVSMCTKILYQSQGLISAALIMGGFDSSGGQLYAIYPHGSVENLPFISMGSGSLAAMSLLENFYCDYMELRVALDIIKESILAGIYNDLGSGGNVDICIITKQSIQLIRSNFSRTSPKIFSKYKSIKKFIMTF
nr:26S proteasome SU [Cryptomonas curvata]